MKSGYPACMHDQRIQQGMSRRRATQALIGFAALGAMPRPARALPSSGETPAKRLGTVLFIPFGEHDLGFSEAAYDGYAALRRDAYRIDLVRDAGRLDETQILAIIERYHAAGARAFILAGSELSTATTAAAARYPDARFATIAGAARGRNVLNYCVDCRSLGGVLAGPVAAHKSRTKIVGFVGGVEAVDGGEAQRFKQAVLEAAPDATVLVDWTHNWDDRKLAMQLTRQQIRAGADIVVADANVAVIAAAAPHPHVGAIAWMTDASRRYRNVVASVIIDTRVIFRRFVADVASGRFAGGDYVVTEADDVWKIVWPRR